MTGLDTEGASVGGAVATAEKDTSVTGSCVSGSYFHLFARPLTCSSSDY